MRKLISALCFSLCSTVHFIAAHQRVDGFKLMPIPRIEHMLQLLQGSLDFLMVPCRTTSNWHIRGRFHEVTLLFSLRCL